MPVKWITTEDTGRRDLWGVPLWVNITPDGYRVGDVYHSIKEAEEAAKESILRLHTIRIQ